MYREWFHRSTTSSPASKTALKRVVETWQMPPPSTSSISPPPTMPGASLYPRAAVRGPIVLSKSYSSPGARNLLLAYSVVIRTLTCRLDEPRYGSDVYEEQVLDAHGLGFFS